MGALHRPPLSQISAAQREELLAFVEEAWVFDACQASGRPRIVIGADGRNSLVARSVEAPTYNVHQSLTCAYYSYGSGVEIGRRPTRRRSGSPSSNRHHP